MANNPWWEVDLQDTINIQRVVLLLSQETLDKNLYGDLVINTREHMGSWVQCAHLGVPTSLTNSLTCKSNTSARYVRIVNVNTDNKYLMLHEVEVYGPVVKQGIVVSI